MERLAVVETGAFSCDYPVSVAGTCAAAAAPNMKKP
jgi:hypothetical protein